MPPLNRRYSICFSIGVAFFLVATVLSDVIARTAIGGEGIRKALAEHVHYALIEPVGTAFLLAPFLASAWIAASLIPDNRTRQGFLLLSVPCMVLAFMYYVGYQDSQRYLAQHMWTAAALAVGLLPFRSVPIVLLGWVVFLILRKESRVEP
jgi:hypothetical protein